VGVITIAPSVTGTASVINVGGTLSVGGGVVGDGKIETEIVGG